MSAKKLYRLLNNYDGTFKTVESSEGVRIIRFEVEEDSGFGLLPLKEATDEQIIAYADSQGYELTAEDAQEIRSGCLASPLWGMLNDKNKTVSRAVNEDKCRRQTKAGE